MFHLKERALGKLSGSILSPINAGSGNFLTGVVDKNNSTLSFTAASAATPEPGSVLGLLAMGGLGLVTLRKRQG
ncbi:MAG: PEP-CTERM sorting domain-containing protein [Microcystis aeruginosa LL11-07]|nr:PEP-CTERM sorting domain-containing protein [Microcystis aeruginosa LL11-07]